MGRGAWSAIANSEEEEGKGGAGPLPGGYKSTGQVDEEGGGGEGEKEDGIDHQVGPSSPVSPLTPLHQHRSIPCFLILPVARYSTRRFDPSGPLGSLRRPSSSWVERATFLAHGGGGTSRGVEGATLFCKENPSSARVDA
ncbi:hypothetical protein NL676_032439 [Syzygium grande]|nr:hypothetical protein NL676_032439 [Syzygium grande]